jgi:hypothetical protein
LFGLVYAATPLVALAVSWWVVRDSSRALFTWAAFGVGLGTLPGQIFFTTESIMAVQLFWPIILAVLSGARKPQVPVLTVLVIAVFFAHPVAVALFAVGAGLAFIVGLRRKDERRQRWIWAFGLGTLCALKLAMFYKLKSDYEIGQLSLSIMRLHFSLAVAGLPLMSLGCAWLAASMVFLSSLVNRRLMREVALVIHSLELAMLLTAGSLLIFWAKDPYLWMHGLNFRSWALFSSCPFIMIAALETLIPCGNLLRNAEDDWTHRIMIIQIVAVIFLLVLSVQSTVWFNLTNRLRETIAESQDACISTSSIRWLPRSPLQHWATVAYSIVLQGKEPQKLLLHGDGCVKARLSGVVRIAPWDLRSSTKGWFDLQPSVRRIRTEQRVSQSCSFILSSGWYKKEQSGPARVGRAAL